MAKTLLVLALFAASITGGLEGWNAHLQIVDLHNQVTDLKSQLKADEEDLKSQLKADEENETKDAQNIDSLAASSILTSSGMIELEGKLRQRHEEIARALR
jgi:hypothetical protein